MQSRILVVDDDPSLRELISLFLEKSGDLAIDTADGAHAAMEMLKSGSYDVIVSDYDMPGMNGIDFLKTLKSGGDPAPFILFTGKGREEVVIEALNHGATFYLQKGGDVEAQFAELVHKVKQAIARMQAERAAKDSRQRIEDILNFLPDPAIAVDTCCELMVWNRAAEEMTGVRADGLLGKGNYEYGVPFYGERRPLLLNFLLDPDSGQVDTLYKILAREKNLLIGECEAGTREGKKLALWVKAALLQDEQGKVTGAIETIRDITDWKRIVQERRRFRADLLEKIEELSANNRLLTEVSGKLRRRNEELHSTCDEMTSIKEEILNAYQELQKSYRSLQESEENYRLLVESLPDTVIIRAGDEILFGNPAALRLFAKESCQQLCETPFHQLIARSGEGDSGQDLQTTLQGIEFSHQELAVLPPGKPPVAIEMTTSPVRYRGRNATQIVLRDVTGRRYREEDLQVQNAELERSVMALVHANRILGMVNTVTRHDIQNQLMIVKGYLTLTKDCISDPALPPFLDKIGVAARSIEQHILFTRDYTGLGVCNPEWQQLEDVISRAREQLSSSGIAISIDVQGLAVFADHLLVKVFSNLIDNSWRHGGTVDQIRVYFRTDGVDLSLFYEDNGTGIPAADKERVFARGFGMNTGLGLFFVREILQVTGMTILENGEPGKGVRFEIKIPSGSFRIVPG